MLRIGRAPSGALENSRAFSHSLHNFANDRRGSSTVATSASAAIIAAGLFMMAPGLGPVLERTVFAEFAVIEGAETAVDAPVQVAVNVPRMELPRVDRGDGSPIQTGSVQADDDTAAARAARGVIDAIDDLPSRRLQEIGLRGSLYFDDE